MLQSDHMRQMMTNPEVMQGMMQIQRAMNPEAQGSAFPAPGAAPVPVPELMALVLELVPVPVVLLGEPTPTTWPTSCK